MRIACSWESLPKLWVRHALQASITVQSMLSCLSPPDNMVKMPIRAVALALDLCVLYYCSLCIQTFHHYWKKRKEGIAGRVFLTENSSEASWSEPVFVRKSPRIVSYPVGIDFLESIPGLFKRLGIRTYHTPLNCEECAYNGTRKELSMSNESRLS